jgi:cobalt-zinc-cadmium efflux system membrane fusion protein
MRRGLELMAAACVFVWLTAGCGSESKGDPKAEAPPQTKVEHEEDVNVVQTDHPEQFPLVAATDYSSTSQIVATGAVTPDVSRTVPVVSLATGRVVEVKARLGDTVKKGQVLLVVQSADIAGAFSDYRKAVADEQLANTQKQKRRWMSRIQRSI